MSRLRLLLLPLLALTQCTPPPAAPTGQTRSDAATLAACREHADAAYNRNNRDSIYTIGNRDSPFSGNYGPAPVDKGLSQRYGRESMIRDCVRNTGTETDRTDAAAPSPGASMPTPPIPAPPPPRRTP
jgi:hypothetical protein